MNPERWRRVQELLNVALERPAEEREAYLAEVRGDDPSLADEVRSLLEQEGDDSFLERPAGAAADDAAADTGSLGTSAVAEVQAGEHIGPYRVLREVGRGGMGVVYEAEQEKPVRRRVALKLVKWGMDTKQVIARFESERQALALMSHPNIAGVFDAGATEQGRPYFAMEYVSGVPITEYCDTHRLGLRERLELFSQVCHGIQHAHQKGIIHRDIKPANVLVTLQEGKPVPKIIDFGVAKATAQRLTEKTLYTELGQMIGTPAYMSPEQAEMTNLDIDTRTDVYSLGALLYELLVGVPPVDVKALREAGFDELRRRIREEEPRVPSGRVTTLGESASDTAARRAVDIPSLGRALRGDLDWIVMKSLAKDRTRRYSTALELADDIGRHLKHEAVLARPPEAGYRVRKFVRRHRVGVIASALVVVTLIVAVAATSVGLVRAREAEGLAIEAERAARQEAAKAKAINAFLQETLGAANPEDGLGRETTVLEVLAAGAARVDSSFADQPEIEAAVRNTIGVTLRVLGRLDEAEEQLKLALAIRRAVLDKGHPDLAESLDELGLLYFQRGEPAAAVRLHREALPIWEEALPGNHPFVANSYGNLANALWGVGDLEGAERFYRRAVAIYRGLDTRAQPALVHILASLGVIVNRQGRIDEAEALYRESVARARRLREGGSHPALATSLNNLARLMERDRGDCQSAEPLYREAITVYQSTLGPGHWMLAHTRGNLAICLTRLGRYEAAEAELLKSIRVLESTFGRTDDRTQTNLARLADLYAAWGRPEKAEYSRKQLPETP